jgi:hypothetical protein
MASRTFKAILFQHTGKATWVFVTIPKRHAPPATHPWGRTPVSATVDGHTWKTSVWRSKSGDSLLAIPKHLRATKGHGGTVRVTLEVVRDED